MPSPRLRALARRSVLSDVSLDAELDARLQPGRDRRTDAAIRQADADAQHHRLADLVTRRALSLAAHDRARALSSLGAARRFRR